jgi:hypothetical protein
MTVNAKTYALSRACAAAALLAGLAAAPAQAAVPQHEHSELGSTLDKGIGRGFDGTTSATGLVSDLKQTAASTGSLAKHPVQPLQTYAQGLQQLPEPSLLWVAALGALCLSLSWRRPASRHAEKLRERLGSAEATTSVQG